MKLLIAILIFASMEAYAGYHTLHGRILTRGSEAFFVYSENGQEKEVGVTSALDDFRGQLMTINGSFSGDFFIVDWALTDPNSLINGKIGRGFMGMGTVNMRGTQLHFTPHLSKALLDEIEGYTMPVKFHDGVNKASGDFAKVSVVGVITKNGDFHISKGFDGFRVREDAVEIQVGDLVVFEGHLGANEDSGNDDSVYRSHFSGAENPRARKIGAYNVATNAFSVEDKESKVLMPAWSKTPLTADLGNEKVRELMVVGEKGRFAAKVDSPGHMVIFDILIFAPADWYVGAAEPVTAPEKPETCESQATTKRPGKPHLRLIKKDDE